MIIIRKRYQDWRLFDTEENKYVVNNAENRNRAMISALIANEFNKEIEEKNTVEEVIYAYYKTLDATKKAPLNLNLLENFFLELDEKLCIEKSLKDKEFQKLALCVLKDQKDEKTLLHFDDLAKYAKEFSHFNQKLFNGNLLEEEKQF